jgi:REP element-mobilizing transposase RayT
MSNLDFRKFYRRRLPHLQIEGATYFVTFRLKNSLPVEILQRLSQEFERIKSLPSDQTQIEERLWFEKFDNYLDRALSGENFLSDSQVAIVVEEAIYYRHTKVYDLISFCIMPNHVHLICKPLEKEKDKFYGLTEILHSLKRHTARQSNLILKRSGSFWQDESYDHVIRDEAELEQIIKYVLYNPVKANLVKEQEDWKWAFCQYDM